jgi:hypothetical protein
MQKSELLLVFEDSGVGEGRGNKAQTRQTFPNLAVPLFATTRNVTSVVKSRTAQVAHNKIHQHTRTLTPTQAHPHTPSHIRRTHARHRGSARQLQGGCTQHQQSSILGVCKNECMVGYINVILVQIHSYNFVFILHWNVLRSEMEGSNNAGTHGTGHRGLGFRL